MLSISYALQLLSQSVGMLQINTSFLPVDQPLAIKFLPYLDLIVGYRYPG